MVMRITQQSLYGTVLTQTNASLLSLVETNNQVASEKRINKPSDDATGTVEVLNLRGELSQLSQYETNITQANGWLTQQDSTLSSVSTLVTSIKALAEQAATGTMTATNREEIATQLRQYYEQLISLANTQYCDSSLFAGQRTDASAFVESLWMTSNDDTFDAAVASNGGFSIAGDADYTVLVEFMASGAGTNQPAFEYSADGGDTWTVGSYATASNASLQTLDLGNGLSMTLSANALRTVKACQDTTDASGTWLWVRPTALYQGNDNDTLVVTSVSNKTVTGQAAGTFSDNVMVRVDEPTNFASNSTFSYSYSLDGGTTWVTANTSGVCDGSSVVLDLPQGSLTLSANGGSLAAGSQFLIQPSRADISIAISGTDAVVVNGVGKDIFGGIYQAYGDTNYSVAGFSASNAGNLFEAVGNLIGYLETNNQDGVSEALASLTSAQNTILSALAAVGGKENRVSTTETMVETLTENATSSMSNVEDADLTELITKLAQQELAYQAVLSSSSKIMSMSLLNYI
jgi:flagellar hook-associated protein 3 FlgL